MENTPRLYDTLVKVLNQHRQWLDVRHLKTLAWMMAGLIETGLINLTSWAPFVHGRAVFAQSSVRRFARWLANERIDVHKLYGPLIQQALTSWGAHTLYLAMMAPSRVTSMVGTVIAALVGADVTARPNRPSAVKLSLGWPLSRL